MVTKIRIAFRTWLYKVLGYDPVGVTGSLGWVVLDKDGHNKLYKPNFIQRLRGQPGTLMMGVNHNIVTDVGDALIADQMQETPERDKVDNTNGVIGVGTGYVSATKSVTTLVTQTGVDEAMDATYPQTEGAWGAANDGVIVYVSTFEAGDLNDTGIDEAILDNGTDTLAYAQITPAIDVATADTLEVTWKITFLGS